MADKIGILGSAGATGVSTTTVYTCPTGKAAKVRIMARFKGSANSQVAVSVANMEIARNAAMTVNHYNFTIAGGPFYAYAAGDANAPDGSTIGKTVAPADAVYHLSAGDTIKYQTVGASLVEALFQVHGIEVDV